MAELETGQVRKGIVKNIADFGAFVDLGGIDGLLHITDMGWHRVTNPHDVVKINQELEVYILGIDRDKEKIALSLKHKTPSPWQNIETKYPVNTRHQGEVVNIMPYGAFVKLEPGIEGLVHISEMSWTKRISHPNEVVSTGDKVEVQVLNINHDKKEISLGMKQCQQNPWDEVAKKYPPGTQISGTVRNLTSYGAFIEIEEGIDGLLHVSDMSWVRKVSNPSEVVQKGQKVTCVVLSVDQERKRVALGLKQMANDPWEGDIPGRFQPGQKVTGKVTKLTNFGVFVELEPGLEGLLHISELSDDKIESPGGGGEGRRRDRGEGAAGGRQGPQDRPVEAERGRPDGAGRHPRPPGHRGDDRRRQVPQGRAEAGAARRDRGGRAADPDAGAGRRERLSTKYGVPSGAGDKPAPSRSRSVGVSGTPAASPVRPLAGPLRGQPIPSRLLPPACSRLRQDRGSPSPLPRLPGAAAMPPEAPPAVPPPFATPDGLSPDAYPAFKRMLKACGKTSFRMPSSCELFLRQYLAHFPAERDLLIAAPAPGGAGQGRGAHRPGRVRRLPGRSGRRIRPRRRRGCPRRRSGRSRRGRPGWAGRRATSPRR